ncbi:MAG TPA: hypothetical protein VF230_00200 [Acidimicrobiales bacterium]
MTAVRWFEGVDGVDGVETLVACSGSQHRITWHHGKVVLHDHRLGEEEVLLALGGAPPPCVAALLAWRDRRGWAASTRPDAPGFTRRTPPPAVPPALVDVRQLGVVRAWERAWGRDRGVDEAEDLYRLLRRRALRPLTAALETARRDLGGGRATFVEVRLAASPDAAPDATGRIDARRSALVVTLAPRWLYRVGAAGALDARGAFVVAPGKVVGWRRVSGSKVDRWEPAIRPSAELAEDAGGVVVGDAFDDAPVGDAGDMAHAQLDPPAGR